MANLLSQLGIRAMTHPDGYTISIMASSPPMYMELDSRGMNISGVPVPGFLVDAHGFCMDIVPGTATPTPVVCGGSATMNYTANCWKLGLGATFSSSFTTLSEPQDGCTLLAFGTNFVVIPGYLARYLLPVPNLPPINSANPVMASYDMSTGGWTTIPNLQPPLSLSNRAFAIPAIMPATGIAVLYGGYIITNGVGNTDLNFFGMANNNWLTGVSPASAAFVRPPNKNNTSNPSDGGSPKSSSSLGVIVGGAIGGLAVVLLIIIAVLLYRKQQSKSYRYSEGNNPTQIELEEVSQLDVFL